MMSEKPIKRLLLPGLVILTLISAGCESTRDIQVRPTEEDSLTEKIRKLEQQGQFGQAAELLIQEAQDKNPAEQAPLYLRASTLLIKSSRIEESKRLLSRIVPDEKNHILGKQINHIKSRISLFESKPDIVLESLLPDLSMPAHIQATTHELRARAYLLSGNTLESARERITLGTLLTEPDKVTKNHEQIWQSLRQLTPAALAQLNLAPPPDILGGWMELARISLSSILDPETFEKDLSTWKTNYPGHPAELSVMEKVLSHYRAIKRPEKLALVLPMSGKLSKPAAAIRDGFIAAYYQNRTNLPRTHIKVYDSNAGPIEQTYLQAVSEGAEFVIGPLDKQRVARLANMTDIKTPILTLNQTDIPPSVIDSFFQFGLNPEDEARQVAERASLEGLVRAIVIAPKGEWGDRLASAFSNRFQEVGGVILEEARYNFSNHDLSGPIKRMLNLDESQSRYNRLRHALPTEIKFEPRRRQDIDFIFMAAFPKQARLIAPQLRFHQAADIPVYTTSHAYNGKVSVKDNRDINGVVLCDSAWILSPENAADPLRTQFYELWPQSMEHYARLYALGVDAYQLLGQIKWLQLNPNERFNGISGRLQLNNQNQIKRILSWGRFTKGRISLLEDIQATPTTPEENEITPVEP